MNKRVALALLFASGCAAEARREAPASPEVARAARTRTEATQSGDEPNPVDSELFAPGRVLARAHELGLSDAAQAAIRADLARSQGEWDSLEARRRTETASLTAVLATPRISEETAREALAAVLRTEAEIKTNHLALLVRVKNHLSTEAQARLRLEMTRPHL